MFSLFITIEGMFLYLSMFMSIAYILQMLGFFEIFYKNPTSAIFKMSTFPPI